MATKYWVGGAPLRTHLVRFTPTVTGTNDFTLTAGQYSVTITPGAATAASVCAAMLAALQDTENCPPALVDGNEVSWSSGTTYLEAETQSSGEWFKFTGSATGGDSWTIATQQEGSGPKILSAPDNWSGGTAPVNGDSLVFQLKSDTIKYDLQAFSGSTFASVLIENFSGTIGLPYQSSNSYKYAEYRPRYFKAGMTNCTVGTVNGQGANSPLVRLDAGSVQCGLRIMGAATTASATGELGAPTVVWKGTNSSNLIYVNRGSLGIATDRGDVATVASLITGTVDQPASDAVVVVGADVTLGDWYAFGGLTWLNCTWSGNGTRYNGRVYVAPGVTPGTVDTSAIPMILGG